MFSYELEGDYLEIAQMTADEQDALFEKAYVTGVGVGHKVTDNEDTGEPCLTVFVSQKLSPEMLSSKDMIPQKIGKFNTDVVETGEIFAGRTIQEEQLNGLLEEDLDLGVQTLRNQLRPAAGGYSIGHYQVTAGTMATAVFPNVPNPGIPAKYYILSNNHVLANSNNARIGDPILQPGRVDGGQAPRDVIGRLTRFVPINFTGGLNLVDAAIAEAEFHNINREVYWIGHVKGIATVNVGNLVQKTGRTTNYTTGRVLAVNASVNVNYGGGRVARFTRQIVTSAMSAPGDSGSLLWDMKDNAVGLLFAGSSTVTIHNDIRFVQALLGIRLT